MRQRKLPALLLALLLLSGCGKQAAGEPAAIDSLEELTHGTIGVSTGSSFAGVQEEYLPESTAEYYSNYPDMIAALQAGKIDAFLADEPVARELSRNADGVTWLVPPITSDNYAFILAPEDEALAAQMDQALEALRADGTLEAMDKKWFEGTEADKVLPELPLTGENGTLRVATNSDRAPFVYVKDGEIVGYEIELVYRVADALGYVPAFTDMDFSGVLPALSSGKADLGAACITVTEERAKSVRFSVPVYTGGCVAVVADQGQSGTAAGDKVEIAGPEDLAGKPVGIRTGTSFDQDLKTYIPTAQAVYYNTESDLIAALQSGKIDAFLNDEPIARALCAQAEGIAYLPEALKEESYAFALPPGREALRDQLNDVIAQLRDEGVLDELETKWFSADESLQTATPIPATGPNGVLRVATNSGSPPFGIIKDGQLAGYDIDVLIEIAERLGYGLELSDMEFVAILPALAAGKADIAASCITVTEERARSVLFTEANYVGGVVIVTRAAANAGAAQTSFWAGLRDSFVSTFVVENRWQLIVRGLGITLLISLLTALFGTALGFAVSFGLRARYRIARLPARMLVSVFQGTPLLVILLILNFVVFRALDATIVVAVIGFSLDFAVTVGGLLNTGIGAVDQGELEAAAALGFSRRQTFLRITLPQVVRRMLPSYQGSFISMVKMTSIVGYIAIQDLTKISDIIRSRTFQAFFPLIATALIYFVLTHLLSAAMGAVRLRLDPARRARTIKGVEHHD